MHQKNQNRRASIRLNWCGEDQISKISHPLDSYPLDLFVEVLLYFDDNDDGHVDTREANFECEKKDENLGCDPGIDVAG